jgi:hypothetical protein
MASTKIGLLRFFAIVTLLAAISGCSKAVSSNSPDRLNDFELTNLIVDRSAIATTNLSRNGMPPLDDPGLLQASDIDHFNEAERGKMLVSSDRVVGVRVDDEARAYPLRLLRWHEVVNDELGGRSIAVTYSGLCDSVVVFNRELEGRIMKPSASGLLYNSNLLFYDRNERESLWSQLRAEAVSGPKAGESLEVLHSQVLTWESWRTLYPETTVIAPDPQLKRRYRRDPYHSYFGSDILRFPVRPLPDENSLHLKERVLSVDVNGHRALYSIPQLVSHAGKDFGEIETTIGRVPVRIRFTSRPPTLSAEPVEPGQATQTRFSCWFAWHAMYSNEFFSTLN